MAIVNWSDLMKIEKRNGCFRVQPQRDGKRYSLTFDHKPTKLEIEQALLEEVKKNKRPNVKDMTFEEACKRYNDTKKNVLSVSTLNGYASLVRRLSRWFLDLKIADITQDDINTQINELALDKSPKTVRNFHGYITAVLGVYRSDLDIRTTLPQRKKEEFYVPTDKEVKDILLHAKGSRYEIALTLMTFGLRRSEVCAITGDDIDGDVLKIQKAYLFSEDKQWIVQDRTKTEASTREIVIPREIADKIKEQGYAYKGHPNNIGEYLTRTQDKLGIRHFSSHKLRHYFCSKLSSMGVPDVDVMAMGGWETDMVMKKLYLHSMQNIENKRDVSRKLINAIY